MSFIIDLFFCRQYCARRLQRIYKGANFLHGKGRFQQKSLKSSKIDDERLLHIPLVSAERAWAYAMDIKNEIEQSNAPSKRHHMIRRVSKAAMHARTLSKLVSKRCKDTRSSLEAEAYEHWITGTMHLERGIDYGKARVHFEHAKKVLNELFKVSDYDQRVSIRHFLDQIEPSTRYCEYQLGRSGTSFSEVLASSGDLDVLASKLEELAAQNDAAKLSGTVAEVEWNGMAYPVREERSKLKVLSAQQLALALDAATVEFNTKSEKEQDESVDSIIQMYDKVVNAYMDARDAVKSASQSGTITESQQLQLKELERAINGKEQEWAIRRNTLLAKVIECRLNRSQKRRLVPSKLKEKSEKPARPEELVRIFETLIANVTSLNDLAAESGGAQGEVLMDSCAAKIAQFTAFKCYFIAHKYLVDNMYAEAYALFQRCQQRCATALGSIEDCVDVDVESKQHVEDLAVKSKAFMSVCIAEYRGAELEQANKATNAVGKLSLEEATAAHGTGTLIDGLENWVSYAGGEKSAAHISSIPPYTPHIPVRPIVLDTAILGIEPPSLDHRVVKEPTSTSSVVSRIFGW